MPETKLLIALLALLLASCSPNSAKKEYVLAEKLWTDGNYAASVNEFEKVYARDPHGKLGLQALFRAATTQAFFLLQYSDAIRKYRTYAEITSDQDASWEARVQIGELLFSKLELYDEAIQHYQTLLQKRPNDPDAALFQFRIAKSRFFLWRFDEAIRSYRELIRVYPKTPWAEKSAYELGVTYYTRGEQGGGGRVGAKGNTGIEVYQDAIDAFESFLKKYPQSPLVPQARFGIASCLEEMDQLEAAYHAYEALKSTYPSPSVIQVKLVRLRERKAQRSR